MDTHHWRVFTGLIIQTNTSCLAVFLCSLSKQNHANLAGVGCMSRYLGSVNNTMAKAWVV